MFPKKRIAFVLPVHNEASNILPLYEELAAVTSKVAHRFEFEFVFVDDGSSDDSLSTLLDLRSVDRRATVLSFSRNFGHQLAVTAGLDAADADAVVIMDTDLQDPPKVAIELIERWEAGAEVVYAQRRSRQDTVFKRATAHTFYWVLTKFASIDIPRNTGDFRLLDRRVVEELRKYREHDRFLRGLVSHVGFRQEAVLFDRDARFSGSTSYPLTRMIRFALDGIFGFSTVPLQLISRLGAATSLVSALGVVYVLLQRLLAPATTVPGWAFVMVSVFFIGGVQMLMLGVLGNYVGRIYVETQNRPLYTVALQARGGLPVAAALGAGARAAS